MHNLDIKWKKKENQDDPCMDVIFSYDEAIDTLYKLANDIEL